MARTHKYDAIIIGAGAAGLMCALSAGKRGRNVLLIDRADRMGAKIMISGGGRCNFTNSNIAADRYISENPRFCLSALKSYTQHDFIKLMNKYKIPFHEKTLGQLFCDESSRQIIDILMRECERARVKIMLECEVKRIIREDSFLIQSNKGSYETDKLVIATGGLSIPKMGATNFAHKIATQFKVPLTDTRPALVPLTFDNEMLKICKDLSGVSIEVTTSIKKTTFRENMLFTHKGLSGPAILQISSYWKEGEAITVNLLPDLDAASFLIKSKDTHPKATLKKLLAEKMPSRLASAIAAKHKSTGPIGEMSNKTLQKVAENINRWRLTPSGTEGFEKAEVTLGGVSTRALSSKTMEVRDVVGLYFIGEAVDVTGWLGGYNLQWAWSSGWAAGNYV